MDITKLSGFFRLSLAERRERVSEVGGFEPDLVRALSSEAGLTDDDADRMIENAVGVIGLPLGLCLYCQVDGRDYFVPMAVEEPSVLAAASYGSKLLRLGGGVTTETTPAHMIGQIQLLEVPDPEAASEKVLAAKDELLVSANRGHERLIAAGGGAVDVEVRQLEPTGDDGYDGAMTIVHLIVDVRDAMGANAINSMCERIAPRVQELTGGRVGFRILSNLADRRLVTGVGRVPIEALARKDVPDPRRLARAIAEGSSFAERDPYRAATHNKGVMNGIDAVLIALGQDWRAVEAGAHAFAARDGRYTALATWRVEGDELVGRIRIPMQVGTVGGVARSHPTVATARAIAHIDRADRLARVAVAVGLAQNLSAVRALAAEGIQRGHMRLHARNVAVDAGAAGPDVEAIAELLAKRGTINVDAARQALEEIGQRRRRDDNIPNHYAHADGSLVTYLEALREKLWPAIQALIEEVLVGCTPDGSRLIDLCRSQLDTGGRRLRALLPMLVAETVDHPMEALMPFGAACELLHNATLVHDDLMDRDLFRRGEPTVWARWGSAEAINIGTAMMICGPIFASRLKVPPARRDEAVKRLVAVALSMIDSQDRELTLRPEDPIDLPEFLALVANKRSSMFALPLAGAADLLGLATETVTALERAGRELGVLFQLAEEAVHLKDPAQGAASLFRNGKRSVSLLAAAEPLTVDERRRLFAEVDRPTEDEGPSARGDEVGESLRDLIDEAALSSHLQEEAVRRAEAVRACVATLPAEGPRRLVEALCDTLSQPLSTKD